MNYIYIGYEVVISEDMFDYTYKFLKSKFKRGKLVRVKSFTNSYNYYKENKIVKVNDKLHMNRRTYERLVHLIDKTNV